MTVNQILILLPRLNRAELRKIHARLSGLLISNAVQESGDEELCYDVLAVWRRAKGASTLSWNQMKRRHMYRKSGFPAAVPDIADFVDRNLPGVRKAVRWRAVGLVMDCCLRWIDDNWTQTPRYLFSAVASVMKDPDLVVDYCFPGYVEAGLFPVIVGNWQRRSYGREAG